MREYEQIDYCRNDADGPHLTEAGVSLVAQYFNFKYNSTISFPIAEYSYTETEPHSRKDHVQGRRPDPRKIPLKPKTIYCCLESYEKDEKTINRLLSQLPRTTNDYRHAFIIYALGIPFLLVYIKEKGQKVLYFHSINLDESLPSITKLYAKDINRITGLPVFYKTNKRENPFTECLMYGKELTGFDPGRNSYFIPNLLSTLNNEARQGKFSYVHESHETPPRSWNLSWFANSTKMKEYSDLDLASEAKKYPAITCIQFFINELKQLGRSSEIPHFVSEAEKLEPDNLPFFAEEFIGAQQLSSLDLEESPPSIEIRQLEDFTSLIKKCPALKEAEHILRIRPEFKLLFVLNNQDKALLALLNSPSDLVIVAYLLQYYPKELNAEFWYHVCIKDQRYADLVLADKSLIESFYTQNLLYFFGHRSHYLAEKLLNTYSYLLQDDEKEAFEGILKSQNNISAIEEITEEKQICHIS